MTFWTALKKRNKYIVNKINFTMVIESLLNPFVLKKKPWEMFFAGGIHSFIAVFLSYAVFPKQAGMLTVFLIVLATLPTLYMTIKNEEELDLKYDKEWKLIREHTKVIIFLLFLFLGVTVALVLSYVLLPNSMTDIIFGVQKEAVLGVNENVQANIAALTGNITKSDLFLGIMLNNLKVLIFCIIFSLIYGTGAIFILTWNASVVATAIGNLIKIELSQITSTVGSPMLAGYFGATTFGFMRYMTHGVFEVIAYFVAGLAGGIISIAIIKGNIHEKRVIKDSLYLVLISLGVLLFAGVVEVYFTPIFFS